MPYEQRPSVSELTGLAKLRKEIENLRRDAVHNTHYFNPQSIKDLCTPVLIKAAVDECLFPDFKKEWICKWINKRGTLTFCILVHIEKERLFTAFLERDVDKKLDDKLPLDAKSLHSISAEEGRKFFDIQWQFIPIILPKREYLQIAEERIMPFIDDHHHGDCDGAFGDIYKVTIDPSMQNAVEVTESDQAAGKIVVIRKQIRFKRNNEGFARERRCLEILQQLKHPNIVDLLCSYTYRDEHSLIFPCEDMDLDDFFNLPDRYRDFVSNHTFYLAIYGLISAVEYVHSCKFDDEEGDFATFIGYHHDIRPRNILVRSNTFLLADFGLANMSEEGQSSTSVKGGGGQYMAPECIDNGHIGRAADIWSLGGVILDIAAYIAHGPQGRLDAQDEREGGGPYVDATTTHFFAEGRVKPGVTRTFEHLHKNPEDKTLRSLLLVSEYMLNVEQDSRPNAHTVRRDIAYVSIKSLFRHALQGMKDWRQRSRESDAGRIWEDTWKLWAWGEEVGINGANRATEKFISALPRAHQDEKKLQHILQDLVRLLDSMNRVEVSESARRGSNRTSTPGQYYGQEATNINDRIRDLRTALPDDYGTRIKGRKAHYGRFANHPPGLPDIADESLEVLSQHKRSLTMPLLKESMLIRTSTDPGLGNSTGLEKSEGNEGEKTGLVSQQKAVSDLLNKEPRDSFLKLQDAQISRPLSRAETPEGLERKIAKSSTTSSPSLAGTPVIRADKNRKQTPKSDRIISLPATPGTNLFSQYSRSGTQTSATSLNPSDSVGPGDQSSYRNKALPPKPPNINLPDPQLDVASSEHGPLLIGTGLPAKV